MVASKAGRRVVVSARTLLLMAVVPVVALFVAAYAGLLSPHRGGVGYAPLLLAGAAGMVPLPWSGWDRSIMVIAAITYAGLVLIALPYVGLLAVCSTGDCI